MGLYWVVHDPGDKWDCIGKCMMQGTGGTVLGGAGDWWDYIEWSMGQVGLYWMVHRAKGLHWMVQGTGKLYRMVQETGGTLSGGAGDWEL